ncbi:MAG: Response regulator NasT [Hydrogenibacillus schlegelii]|uniref:Response regulator NasT n=1 Tax=Hydrogenibacillus schlegelii TaxID=1484 RepID=A0A2T5G885_HYDSH|nr:ANTAR domain-containing protein [Hydrogenibacillus schlegelii]PTQ52400.1 MAG: Response regulator NasT [Hydrogenibacillus schlegelii]
MTQLKVVALGFDLADAAARLPRSLVETGWLILVQLEWPSEEWLTRQEADLFVLRMEGVDDVAERTRTLGRVTGRPVLWITDPVSSEVGRTGDAIAGHGPGTSGEPVRGLENLWVHLGSEDWPVWTVLPRDVPRWQMVAVCRVLMTTAERLHAAKRRAEEALRKLEDRKLIERAKGILMDRFDLSESLAYKFLRDTAMRQRKPLREIAQSIIEYASHDP